MSLLKLNKYQKTAQHFPHYQVMQLAMRLSGGGYSWFFLVPIYLFIRARKLKQRFTYPTVWIVCFIISIFLPTQLTNILPHTNYQNITMVKNSHFLNYMNVSIGNAFTYYFENPKWEQTKEAEKTYISYTGIADYKNDKSNIVIQFELTDHNKNFIVNSIITNGQSLDQQSMNDFIKEVYFDDV
jgi:hypothetical protein